MRFLKLVAWVLAAATALGVVLTAAYFTCVARLWMRANASRGHVAPAGGSSRHSAA